MILKLKKSSKGFQVSEISTIKSNNLVHGHNFANMQINAKKLCTFKRHYKKHEAI